MNEPVAETPERGHSLRPRKLKSGSVSLWHIDDGLHAETLRWHDNDHKAEALASVPGLYISQRWVSPPEWLSLRPPNRFRNGGGQYVNIYGSSVSADEMDKGFTDMRQVLVADGRMRGYDPMQRVWPEKPRRRLRPTAVHRGSDVAVSAEAVIVGANNTGVMVLIGQVAVNADLESFTQWHEQEYTPALLETGLFRGSVRYVSDAPDLAGAYVLVCYTDGPAPDEAYVEFLKMTGTLGGNAGVLPPVSHSGAMTFSAIYRPSIGHYQYYD